MSFGRGFRQGRRSDDYFRLKEDRNKAVCGHCHGEAVCNCGTCRTDAEMRNARIPLGYYDEFDFVECKHCKGKGWNYR